MKNCKKFGKNTVVFLLGAVTAFFTPASADLDSNFAISPIETHALNWYWLNGSIENSEVDRQLIALRDSCGFSGIVPCFAVNNWLSNPAFIDKFHHMMDKCSELGMKACVNDDFYYPSGSAGGAFAQFPALCMRILTKTEKDVTGPVTAQMSIPAGTLIGCVAMNNNDHTVRIDITANAVNGSVTWNAPAGSWKIMAFVTRQQGNNVNTLDAAAVQKWISLTYQKFYDAMPEHYGTTIHSEFFDDIEMSWNAGEYQISWIDNFNAEFRAKHGFDPLTYYPAMYYDIGSKTIAARNLLFGFQVELITRNFGGTVAAWCAAHKIDASGHYASTPLTDGFSVLDPIKFFKYIQRVGTEGYPGMDVAYKIQSSACYLYDKPLLVNQHYAYILNFHKDQLYTLGMESYARGVNKQYADGAQYSPKADFMPPELSWRNPVVAAELPRYNQWTGRCEMLLQGGRHVADIAVLFPIAAILGERTFKDIYGYSDYDDVAARLTNVSKRDFTFMHPEVLDSNCTIDPITHTLNLNNKTNWEKYRVFIIPGDIGYFHTSAGAVYASTMRKAKELYEKGGVVIFTSRLPNKAAEFDQDTAVVNITRAMLGLDPQNPGVNYKKSTNANGGKAYFVGNISEDVGGVDRLTWVLNDALAVWDVKVDPALSVSGGPFSYIHKVLDNADYYFFANSSTTAINTQVRLRGRLTPRIMDPHTGTITNAQFQNVTESGQDVTVVNLKVDPVKSIFIQNGTPTPVGFRSTHLQKIPEAKMSVILVNSRYASVRIGSIPLTTYEGLEMKIFSANGVLVRVLKMLKPSAGSQSIVFASNSKPMPAGAYVCRIQGKGFAKTMGFVLASAQQR